jgi:hypothetical protein
MKSQNVMRHAAKFIPSIVLLSSTSLQMASAQRGIPGQNLLDTIVQIFINPIVALIFSLGMLMFMWGLVEFMWKADSATAKETGGKHIAYGLFGMLIMVAVWGVIAMVTNTLGLSRSSNGLWE